MIIGTQIHYTKGYPMKCSERFVDDELTNGRSPDPTPCRVDGKAYVIGFRMAIMSEFKFKKGYTSHSLEEYAESIPSVATGKREECLVVSKQLKPFKPFLVRKTDYRLAVI